MTEGLSFNAWITAFELPALAGLFWLSWRNRREGEDVEL